MWTLNDAELIKYDANVFKGKTSTSVNITALTSAINRTVPLKDCSKLNMENCKIASWNIPQ